MLFVKIQDSQPILLDQTQLTDESILTVYLSKMYFEINLVIALNDKKNLAYIEEIKKRRYTKEFHAFIKSCVSIRLESRYKN